MITEGQEVGYLNLVGLNVEATANARVCIVIAKCSSDSVNDSRPSLLLFQNV